MPGAAIALIGCRYIFYQVIRVLGTSCVTRVKRVFLENMAYGNLQFMIFKLWRIGKQVIHTKVQIVIEIFASTCLARRRTVKPGYPRWGKIVVTHIIQQAVDVGTERDIFK
jgi:hypothetical protein